jgi:hypothetical protein
MEQFLKKLMEQVRYFDISFNPQPEWRFFLLPDPAPDTELPQEFHSRDNCDRM